MKKSKHLILLLSVAAILSSCGPVANTEPSAPTSESTSESASTGNSSSQEASTSSSQSTGGFNRAKSLTLPLENASKDAPSFSAPQTDLPSGVKQETKYLNNVNDVYWPVGFDALETWPNGDNNVHKLLVVPVSFTDKRTVATEGVRQDISKTFFGAASDTGWESVSSYYYKSSRGQFILTGEVTQWIDLGIRTRDLSDDNLEAKVIQKIYNTLPADMLREYDLNNDGWLDSLWIVYGTGISTSNTSPFWAYVSWLDAQKNLNKPYPCVFGWASYQFMYEGGEAGLPQFQSSESGKYLVDAHTFIHETGHMIGLNDYYDYDGKSNPSGGIDMMGNNIIDHNAYSKFLLNWNLPIVPNGITTSTNINLRPATTSGDFILLNPEWNGSVYDEYILIEYYTPDLLNYQDGAVAYDTNFSYAQGHTQAGVRIWHVDSRLFAGPIRNDWFSFDYQVDPDPVSGDVYKNVTNANHYVYFGTSNTSSESKNDSWDQLKLLDASGAGAYYTKYDQTSSNSSLFKSGQSITNWNTYLKNGTGKFNAGNSIGFNVTIGAMTESGVEISLTKTN